MRGFGVVRSKRHPDRRGVGKQLFKEPEPFLGGFPVKCEISKRKRDSFRDADGVRIGEDDNAQMFGRNQ